MVHQYDTQQRVVVADIVTVVGQHRPVGARVTVHPLGKQKSDHRVFIRFIDACDTVSIAVLL